MSSGQHYVYFYDGDGGRVGMPRPIVQVLSSTAFAFHPRLNQPDLALIQDTGGTFEIRTCGGETALSIAGITAIGTARSL